LLLRTNTKIVTTIENKTKIIFCVYFLSLSIVSIDNIKKFSYLFLIKNKNKKLKQKIIKATHKVALNKILKINNIINRALRQLICVVSKQIKSLFDKYIKKEMQLFYFKKTITIILRKSNKKKLELLFFKSIVLFDILNKILKSIISKRLRYIIEIYNILLCT